MAERLPPDQVAWLYENVPDSKKYIEELTEEFNAAFGLNISQKVMKNRISSRHLRTGAKKRHLTVKKFWTEDKLDWLREHAPGVPRHELTEMWNAAHEEQLEYRQICSAMKNYHIRNGRINETKFKAGVVSYRLPKGTRLSPPTEFKKGHRPHNAAPVGTIRKVKFGLREYRQIKVAEPSKWVMMSRYVWEKENGPLPKGYGIVFIDTNSLNDNIDNLAAMPKKEMAEVCSMLKKVKTTKENFDTVRLLANVNRAKNKAIQKNRRKRL